MTEDSEIEKIKRERDKYKGQRDRATELIPQSYSNRTSFIFELLQNTEDALRRNEAKNGKVRFVLQNDQLSLSHYGKPFNKKDVESICDIGNSTKSDDEDTIGKFGVGFKSVYDFTSTPRIFSGDEHFEIRDKYDYFPISPLPDLAEGETRIILPFENPDDDFVAIKEGLNRLQARDILFLRYIKILEWQVEGDDFCISKEEPKKENHDDLVRFVTITEHDGTKEKWLIFSQGDDKETRVEIAFPQDSDTKTGKWELGKVQGGKTLYSYFPIINQTTDLKFLVQGAFQTTLSRETLASHSRNSALIKHASNLLIEILRWLKRKKKLNWDVFDCLPIEKDFFDSVHDFPPTHDFSPMAEKIRDALKTEELLPARRGGFVAAEHARIPENEKLMTIFDSNEISKFFGNKKLCWLRSGLSPKVRNFLLSPQLRIEQLDLFDIMQEQHITPTFMNRQSDKRQRDKWVQNLYALLLDEIKHDYRFDELKALPLICLKGGGHTSSHDQYNKPQVYLPPAPKSIKTIKPATITTPKAKAFIKKLGIETYDDTNGLIDEMRKRYAESHADDFSEPEEYKEDIKRIIAIQKDEKKDKGKKDTFSDNLKDIRFVKAKNMKTDEREVAWKCPEEVYIATENLDLETLFSGVDAYLVHDDLMKNDLMKDDIRKMLIHYGAKDHLESIKYYKCHLPEGEQKKRLGDRDDYASDLTPAQNKQNQNRDIKDLDGILASFEKTPKEERLNKAKTLWEALRHIKPYAPEHTEARTFYTNDRRIKHNAKFIDALNETQWIPDSDGNLKKPDYFLFDDLDWKSNKTLQDKICFQSDITGQFKKEKGLSDEDLESLDERKEIAKKIEAGTATPDEEEWYKGPPKPHPETTNKNTETKQRPRQRGIDALRRSHRQNEGSKQKKPKGDSSPLPPNPPKKPVGGGGAVNPEVAEAAIKEVMKKYKKLDEHNKLIDANEEIPNNPGFDLYEVDKKGKRIKWVEVKGKAGAHNEYDVPVMTPTQRGFALGLHALGEGHRYVHITVSNALDDPKLHPVENPANTDHEIDKDSEE